MNILKPWYGLPFDSVCMHGCALPAKRQMNNGIHALDIVKGLIGGGFHPPAMYFPLQAEEAVIIEPAETESKQILDGFIAAMKDIAMLAESDPDKIRSAPVTTDIQRPMKLLPRRS